MVMAACAGLFVSCSKDDSQVDVPAVEEGQEAVVRLSVVGSGSGLTKASGSGHGDQNLDNTVNTLEVLIFRNGEADRGRFETYQMFDAERLAGGLEGLEVKATTGPKIIYVVCNSHRDDAFKGMASLDDFRRYEADLKKENCRDFIMVGSAEATLATTTSVTVNVDRLISRVVLSDVHTKFDGTPLEGKVLTDVKAYLINVRANKLMAENRDCESIDYVNLTRYDGASCEGAAMPGMFYEEVAGIVDGDNALKAPEYFYAFENVIEEEDPDALSWFTRLVIEAKLDGVTYYYPINVNRAKFGYVESDVFRQGIERNKSYELRVEITRIGSDDPNTPIEYGTLVVNAVVNDWVVAPVANIVF